MRIALFITLFLRQCTYAGVVPSRIIEHLEGDGFDFHHLRPACGRTVEIVGNRVWIITDPSTVA
jgi:hypothetical protein